MSNMDGVRAIIGKERTLHEVAQTLYFSARAIPAAAAFGALHATCADESENECSEAFLHGFVQYLLPPLKFSKASPFRLANLGGRYEWTAARLTEQHYATSESARGFKVVVAKLNSHVACEETVGAPGYRLGKWKRYGRESISCGALGALLDGTHGGHLSDLEEAFSSEGHDRIATLRDPLQVDPLYAPLYAAVVSARLQARKAVLDIQDATAHSPTYWVVLPCVSINRAERDTEIVCGMYVMDGREGGTEAIYTGLGDRPEEYATTFEHKRFSISDGQLGTERKGRDHRAMIRAALEERLPEGRIRVHDERLDRVRADLARNKHRKHGHARHLLRVALPIMAEVAPVPTALLAFADGAAGIHHAFRVHRLAKEMEGTAEAQHLLEEIEAGIDQLDGDKAEALLELLLADYR